MAMAVEILERAIAAFDVSTQQLLDHHLDDGEDQEKLQKFVHGCKCACTANLNWGSVYYCNMHTRILFPNQENRIQSGRYDLGSQSPRDIVVANL